MKVAIGELIVAKKVEEPKVEKAEGSRYERRLAKKARYEEWQREMRMQEVVNRAHEDALREEVKREAKREVARRLNAKRRLAAYIANPGKANVEAWRAGFTSPGLVALFVTCPKTTK